MNGIIGLHIEANSVGYSRDSAMATALQVGGKFCVVVNDPLLCSMLLEIGITPIYRINRQGFLDDNAHQRGYRAGAYVRQANMEVPDKRVLLYLNNEPGQNDLHILNDFTLEGVFEANALGRKLVALNWSYGNPEPSAWDELAPCVRALVAGGHYVGFHEGVDLAHPTLASCSPDLIGRFLEAKRRFGFKALITEWAASKDAYHGWQTWMSAQQYASVTEDAARLVYAPNGVAGVMPFTLFKWQDGFDYHQSDELKNAFKGINLRVPVKDQPVTQPVPAPTTGGMPRKVTGFPANVLFRNIRKQPGATDPASDVGDLKVGDVITAWLPLRPDGWTYIKRAADNVEGWVLFTGVLTTSPDPIPVPVVKGKLLTPAKEAELRAHLAAIAAILDSAEAVAEAPAPTFPAVA